jgi:DedD protein
MGLFSRKDSPSPRKPTGKPRPSVSSEAQAVELRARARRRLAGSVVLVLAAVVVLPMLLDSEQAPVSNNIAIRIPDRTTPFQANLSEPAVPDNAQGTQGQTSAAGTTANLTPADSKQAEKAATGQQTAVPDTSAQKPAETKVAPKPEPKPKTDTSKSTTTRTDDGSRASALLEGRPTSDNTAPPGSAAAMVKPPTKGNFVVQVSSLDSSGDAQALRGKLSSSGITNAFVDGPVAVNGVQKYRVRVGPFPSREAAQAAQTRLRTLGFRDAYIPQQ